MARPLALALLLALLSPTGVAATAPTAAAPEAAQLDEATVIGAARAANEIYQRHLALLIVRLRSQDLGERVAAITAIGMLVDPATIPLLTPSLESARDPQEQCAAAIALGHIGDQLAVAPLKALLDKAPEGAAREASLNALNQLKAMAVPDYLAHTKDADPVLTGAALTDLGTLRADKATDILASGLAHDRRQIVRRMCAIGLGLIGDRNQGIVLLDALGDADPGVRRYAAEALVKLNYTPAVPYLLMALEGNVAGAYMNRCLMLMTSQDFGFDWRASDMARSAAVEKGFRWWTDHAAELSH